jgi:hypothetical protein
MRGKRRGDQPRDYTNPAEESIDEALARLARQDARHNPAGPPVQPSQEMRPYQVARDRMWIVLRWVVVLAAAWAIWRLVRGEA